MVVLHIRPVYLLIGRDGIDILLDIGVTITVTVLYGIAGVVGVQTVLLLALQEGGQLLHDGLRSPRRMGQCRCEIQ